jgi:four helix bundle protein
MGEIRTFRDLIAWQKAMQLAQELYSASAIMPDSERFGLTSPMPRSAVSIPPDIAEGYARQSTDEYLRFLRIARGSLAELSTQAELAARLRFMQPPPILADLLAETDRVLQGLIRSLER